MTKPFMREALLRSIDTLPVLPTVLTTVMSLDPDAEDFFEELTALAEHDPLFAARVIQLANTALYHGSEPALSVQTAITRLGTRAVADILVSMSVMRVFVPRTPEVRSLWLHALHVAIGARRVAIRARLDTDVGLLYLAGLVHDVGRFIMLDVAPQDLHSVEEEGFETPGQLVDIERTVCGIDHASLGAQAASAWGLPQPIIQFIRKHHLDPSKHPPAQRGAYECLQLVDHLSTHVLRHGYEEEAVEDLAARLLFKMSLTISPARAAQIMPNVLREADAVMESLHV